MYSLTSEQHQEQDKCVADTAFVYTEENMGLEEGEKQERRWPRAGGGMWGTDSSLITSFLARSFFSFFFFIYRQCQNNSRKKKEV